MDLLPVIILGGLGSTGSTTLARKLSQALDLTFYSVGEIIRSLCVKEGICTKEDIKNGMFEKMYKDLAEFLKKNPKLNQKIDQETIEIIKNAKNPTCIEGRIASALATKEKLPVILKIWITADITDRVKRFRIKNPKTTLPEDEIAKILLERDKLEAEQYFKLYQIELDKPSLYNDIVLDTSGLSVEDSYFKLIQHEVFREKIKKLWQFFPSYDVVYRWKCEVCGYLYEGFTPIHLCPHCGNIDEQKITDLT